MIMNEFDDLVTYSGDSEEIMDFLFKGSLKFIEGFSKYNKKVAKI